MKTMLSVLVFALLATVASGQTALVRWGPVQILPVLTAEQAKEYYGIGRSSMLNQASVAVDGSGEYLTLAADLVTMLAGPVRLGLGAAAIEGINGPLDPGVTEPDEVLGHQRERASYFYVLAGGNVLLHSDLPLIRIGDAETPAKAVVAALAKTGMDFQGNLYKPENFSVNVFWGLELDGTVLRDQAKFQIYVTVAAGLVSGNNQFYDSLDGDVDGHSAFWLARFGAGVALFNTVRIGVVADSRDLISGFGIVVEATRQ